MSTLKFVASLAGIFGWAAWLMFFVPWALNARNSFLNAVGVVAISATIFAVMAAVHFVFTNNEEE